MKKLYMLRKELDTTIVADKHLTLFVLNCDLLSRIALINDRSIKSLKTSMKNW